MGRLWTDDELRGRAGPRSPQAFGSGVVEAACKTLVAQRLKQSERGGQAILNLRGWAQSGPFDAAWAELAATYQMDVTVVASIVRIR